MQWRLFLWTTHFLRLSSGLAQNITVVSISGFNEIDKVVGVPRNWTAKSNLDMFVMRIGTQNIP